MKPSYFKVKAFDEYCRMPRDVMISVRGELRTSVMEAEEEQRRGASAENNMSVCHEAHLMRPDAPILRLDALRHQARTAKHFNRRT